MSDLLHRMISGEDASADSFHTPRVWAGQIQVQWGAFAQVIVDLAPVDFADLFACGGVITGITIEPLKCSCPVSRSSSELFCNRVRDLVPRLAGFLRKPQAQRAVGKAQPVALDQLRIIQAPLRKVAKRLRALL